LLCRKTGELPEWIDHANIVIEASRATASYEEQVGDGLLEMVKAQIDAVQLNVRGGNHPQDGGETQSIDSEFVRTYAGSSEAIAARAAHAAEHVLRQEAAGRSWVNSSCWTVQVGTVIRHSRYGYRGVVYGYDPCCMASESWQQQMNVSRLQSGAGTRLYKWLCAFAAAIDDSCWCRTTVLPCVGRQP
jgi:hypothetical protein